VIDRELEQRIAQNLPFAHLYIDLDNFKAYGDHYGYKTGSDAINLVGNLIQEVVERHGGEDDLVGHIGGDDYVVLTEPDRAEEIAKAIISTFDRHVPELYNEKDLKEGFILGTDRYGIKRTFPLLTMSIAITLSENLEHPSLLTISHNCARMKSHLKQLKNSNYLIDRRKQLP
jgi:GGDEF domain-containing protein